MMESNNKSEVVNSEEPTKSKKTQESSRHQLGALEDRMEKLQDVMMDVQGKVEDSYNKWMS